MRGVTCFQAIATISAPISTRTPHAGSDSQSRVHLGEILQFQPALPMRGVTKLTRYSRAEDVFQPALPMRGVTLDPELKGTVDEFQPALPMRGVTPLFDEGYRETLFQPALPMRGVTYMRRQPIIRFLISTRTPHAGSDSASFHI